jgi:hypothetical protein
MDMIRGKNPGRIIKHLKRLMDAATSAVNRVEKAADRYFNGLLGEKFSGLFACPPDPLLLLAFTDRTITMDRCNSLTLPRYSTGGTLAGPSIISIEPSFGARATGNTSNMMETGAMTRSIKVILPLIVIIIGNLFRTAVLLNIATTPRTFPLPIT